jgi:hypothetical protein
MAHIETRVFWTVRVGGERAVLRVPGKIVVQQGKLHGYQQVGNKFAALKSASSLAEPRSWTPLNEYSKFL